MMKSDTIARLEGLNRGMDIKPCGDSAFSRYGRVLDGFDFSGYAAAAGRLPAPGPGVTYVPSDGGLERLDVTTRLESEIFGEMPLQAGWCRGSNVSLPALEYHKSAEIVAAVTDILLVLGRAGDIDGMTYDTAGLRVFFLGAGGGVELHPLTLHFAPIQCGPDGFCAVIVLPRGTNLPLDSRPVDRAGEGRLLFQKNKWLIASPGSPQEERGAYPGLAGSFSPIRVP